MRSILIRGLIYFLVAIFLGESIHWELEIAGDFRPFTDFGYIEFLHSLFLLTVIMLLFLLACRVESFRHLSVCMALFFVVLLIRENDKQLELFLSHGSWKLIVIFPVVALAVYFWKNRRQVLKQLVDYAQTPSFGVLLSGFLVLLFSRLFGKNVIWQQLMGEHYIRGVKNAAEESMETLALGLLTIAVAELFIAKVRNKKDQVSFNKDS